MKKLRFRTQLIIGFSVILFISISIGVLALMQIGFIRSQAELAYLHPFTVSISVRDINANASAIQRLINEIAAADNSKELNNYIHQVDQYDSLTHQKFDIVKKNFLGEKSLVDSAMQVYTEWENTRKSTITLAKNGNFTEAAIRADGVETDQLELLIEKTKKLSDFAENKAYEFYQNSVKAEKQSILRFLFSITILLILSIVIAYIILKDISQPISKFISEINVLLKKRDLTERRSQNGSEQELLSNTVLELKKAYSKLEEFNTELEHQVRIRTKELSDSKEKLLKLNEEYLSINEEFKAQNEELLNINEELEISEARLKELNATNNKLFSIIAHDLRSPFSSILGFSELLINNVRTYGAENSLEFITHINTTADHTLNLLDNLLTWAKTQTGQIEYRPKNLHLHPIIQEIIQVLNSSAAIKNITLNSSPSDGIGAFADPNMLKTVLRNLVQNAIKYTNSGGTVDIQVVSQQNQVIITVLDNGVGMNEETLNKLFRIDSTLIKNGTAGERGSGLGLILCKEFVERNGGKISVESKVRIGSSFSFTIPGES